MPLPFPLAPEVMVMKLELVSAVQVHPDAAVTLTLPRPPAAATVADCDERVNVQDCPGVMIT